MQGGNEGLDCIFVVLAARLTYFILIFSIFNEIVLYSLSYMCTEKKLRKDINMVVIKL